jgi:DNA transformation protein
VHFAKKLRPLVQSGQVRCSVRIWKQPRVRVGGRYALPPGEIEVVSLRGIGRRQITSQLARRSGFDSVEDLLAVAQHGEGDFVFLVEFVYRDSPSGEVRSSRGRRPGRQDQPVGVLRNIGPTIARRLEAVGVRTRGDLESVGPAEIFRRVSDEYPSETISLCYYLYSLEGALRDLHWDSIGDARKAKLRRAAGLED